MSKIIAKIDIDLKHIIPGFLERKQNDISRLTELLNNKDIDGLKAIGHELKGACGSYGFTNLATVAKNIEMQAKGSDLAAIEKSVNEFKEILENMEVEYIEVE